MQNNKAKLLDEELELLKTRSMLNKLVELNLSLYHAILNYAQRKGIPLTLDSRILQLAEEIERTDIVAFSQSSMLSDEKKHLTDSDTEVTVPNIAILK